MLFLEYQSYNIGKLSIKLNIHIYIFLLISNLFLIQCEVDENLDDRIPKQEENIIIFNHTKLNAGSMNKNGDLIIEYYSDENYYDIPNSILFYCLSKNGRQCFSNESSYTKENNIDIDEIIDINGYYNYFSIYDSKNLFVSIKSDSNSADKYLFSINSYNSIVELHNFDNNADKNRYIWDINYFFNLEDDFYTFQFERELYEISRESAYIITFIPKEKVDERIKNLSFIKKFIFNSFNDTAYKELKSIEFNNYVNRIIMTTFFMDDCGILVIISYKIPDIHPTEGEIMFNVNLFNNNLQPIAPENGLIIPFDIVLDDYKYFKSIYLNKNYVIFAFITFSQFWFGS